MTAHAVPLAVQAQRGCLDFGQWLRAVGSGRLLQAVVEEGLLVPTEDQQGTRKRRIIEVKPSLVRGSKHCRTGYEDYGEGKRHEIDIDR